MEKVVKVKSSESIVSVKAVSTAGAVKSLVVSENMLYVSSHSSRGHYEIMFSSENPNEKEWYRKYVEDTLLK